MFDLNSVDGVFKQALAWANKHYVNVAPNDVKAFIYNTPSPYHLNAFGNSVVYLVLGVFPSNGGGPSVRSHLVSWSLVGDGTRSQIETNLGSLTVLNPDGRIKSAGQWKFTEACEYAAPICFGALPALAKTVYKQEHCFDDDPQDLLILREF